MPVYFTKRIKGKDTRLSITVPKRLADEYDLKADDFVNVILGYDVERPELKEKFGKKVCACGSGGLIIYLPDKVRKRLNLHRDQIVTVTLYVLGEV